MKEERKRIKENKRKKKERGFTLVELLLSMALFAMVGYSLASFASETIRYAQNRWSKVEASAQILELSNALITNKNDLWNNIVSATNGGNKKVQFSNNSYQIVSGTSTTDSITTSFQVANVNRDSNMNIVTSGGTQDRNTRAVTYTATWTDTFGNSNSVSSLVYLTNWATQDWIQTTVADFNQGTNNSTYVQNVSGGEVRLGSVVYANWCNPTITTSSYDLPGQGIAQSIYTIQGNSFVGTGSNASGVAFANVLVDNNDPPGVSVPNTYSGFKTNAVFGDGTYGYIATDNNSKEVDIINLSNYTEAGYFDAPGNGNGGSIYVSGNYGYMTTGSKFYVFDLSSKSGSRSQVGSAVTIAGTGTKIVINGNYAYVTNSGTTNQLQIIDISNPSSASVVGQAALTASGAVDVYVNSGATRAYVATSYTTGKNEFFIIDITTKTGNHSAISSFNTSSMNPTGVTVVPDGTNRAIIVGTGGTQQYQVIDISNESSLSKCGGVAVSSGVNAVQSIKNTVNGNAYSYILTGSSSAELEIIRGGAGGGDPNTGQGYPSNGSYTSATFDTTSATASFYALTWTATVPANTTLKFQVRSGASTPLTGTWIGPDGTSGSYFTDLTGQYFPAVLQNNRYVQYQAYFTSDTISTPVLNDTDINYQK